MKTGDVSQNTVPAYNSKPRIMRDLTLPVFTPPHEFKLTTPVVIYAILFSIESTMQYYFTPCIA